MKNETPVALFVPTLADVERVRVGGFAPNAFGRMARVVEISYRGVDRKGAAYVGYFTSTGTGGGSMSASLKVGELVRSVATSRFYKSAELDSIEREMNAAGERLRGEFDCEGQPGCDCAEHGS